MTLLRPFYSAAGAATARRRIVAEKWSVSPVKEI
jgi:hypothetical protein